MTDEEASKELGRGIAPSPEAMGLLKSIDMMIAGQVIEIPAVLEGGVRGLLEGAQMVARKTKRDTFGRVYTEEAQAARRAKQLAEQIKRAAIESSEKRRLQKMRGKKRGKR